MDAIHFPKPAATRLVPAVTSPERGAAVATAPEKAAAVPQAPLHQVEMSSGHLSASFDYDQSLKQFIIVVTDPSGEVVRQIPDEKVRRVLAGMMDELGKVLDARG